MRITIWVKKNKALNLPSVYHPCVRQHGMLCTFQICGKLKLHLWGREEAWGGRKEFACLCHYSMICRLRSHMPELCQWNSSSNTTMYALPELYGANITTTIAINISFTGMGGEDKSSENCFRTLTHIFFHGK